MTKLKPTSIRFSETAKMLLDKLSVKLDITRPAILELAIKEFAMKYGVYTDAKETDN